MKNILLAFTVLCLLTACSPGINIPGMLDDSNVATVNKLSGDRAELFIAGLEGFCQDIESQDIFRVQLIDENKTTTTVFDTSGNVLCELDTSDPEFSEKSIAIIVNNKRIYLNEVLDSVNSLPAEMRTQGAGDIVNNLINQELLLQEAMSQDITASEDEVNEVLERSTFNPDELTKVKVAIREQVLIQKLVDKALSEQEVSVTNSETRAYYDENVDSFVVPGTWSIRHIQLNLGEGDEETLSKKTQTVVDMLRSNEFCDIVSQFSDDVSSKDNCGRLVFAPGQMLPSIEDEVETMEEDEVKVVKSNLGYHIIVLDSTTSSRTARYGEVRESLVNFLELQKRQEALSEFLNGLRQDAKVVSYIS